jgi:hypothetical protein
MSAASAEISGKRLSDFGSVRVRVSVKQRLCGHDHSVDTVAALRRLLGDESLLQWMQLVDGTEPFERDHRGIAHARQWQHAGTDRLGADDRGARAALRKAAPEFRSVEAEIVAQNVKQRRLAVGRDGVFGGVYAYMERFGNRILLVRWV